jgi:hypothetical protein
MQPGPHERGSAGRSQPSVPSSAPASEEFLGLFAEPPTIDHADLFVFSPEDWERRKDQLIYERWVDEAGVRVAADLHTAP